MSTPDARLRDAKELIDSIPRYSREVHTPPGPQMCPHACSFADWSEVLVSTACAEDSLVALNQAKLLLLDRYFMWRINIPLRHQVLASPSAGHACIFAVFESAYRRLQDAVLSFDPPPLAVPPPPSPPRPPARRYAELNGIPVAELLDDEFD